MIPYDLVYLRPATVEEAVGDFERSRREGLDPSYYAGGTEILSFIRRNKIRPRALIDIKDIPECREAGRHGEQIFIGAALDLNGVVEGDHFPLLSRACRGIADHTVRNRLTLGGNICGHLPYRESVLALLVADAELEIAGAEGRRWQCITALFDRRLCLEPGELLVRIRLSRAQGGTQGFHGRRQRGTRVDYPLVSCCLLELEGSIRLAVGGVCGFPLRDRDAERPLNDPTLDWQQKVAGVIALVAPRIRGDFRGSAAYRSSLLTRILLAAEGTMAEGGRG